MESKRLLEKTLFSAPRAEVRLSPNGARRKCFLFALTPAD